MTEMEKGGGERKSVTTNNTNKQIQVTMKGESGKEMVVKRDGDKSMWLEK